MELLWKNDRTANRFANKHLYIATKATSVMALFQEGKSIFNQRLKAAYQGRLNRQDDQERYLLRGKYGQALPPVNTLLVFSIGGFKDLEALIIKNNCRSGVYKINNGYIFTANNRSHQEGLGGTVDLEIRPVAGRAKTYEVYHLKSASVSSVLFCSATAANQLHIQSFVPKVNDLVAARQSLKSDMAESFKWLFGE